MIALVVVIYVLSFLFLVVEGEIKAHRELRRCTKTEKGFFECPADGYFSYKTVDGKSILFKGEEDDKFAYYHELGHLTHDNFIVSPALTSTVVFPIFLLSFPLNLLSATTLFLAVKWYKKMEERRADLFAHEVTGLKYTPVELERNRMELLLHWLIWSHPPEKVRISEEYYKKGSLIRLFLKSLLS